MTSFGTDEEIRRIVEQYSSMLLHLAGTRLDTAADAEDAVQEVFLRLLTTKPCFRDAGHERAWLIRATLHRASDMRRSAERRNVPLDGVTEPSGRENAPSLLSAVRTLPDKYSAVIHLYYYEGYSIKEIARILGLPAGTVGTRLARGRERLRQMLEEDI